MGHGKETPRQKMVGMMYLVLTALLALNVSKDVLDAFVLVDDGMMKTIENFEKKNESVYGEFLQQYEINQAKVEKYWNEAQKIKEQAQEIYDFIQDQKLEIIITSEGEDTEAIHKDEEGHVEIHGKLIGGKDNKDVPAQIMVGDNNDKAGKELKNKIADFRDYLLTLIDDNEQLKIALEQSLTTEDHDAHEGEAPHSWESYHFEHLPLAGVLTIMTGLQADIRNAEADIINYLFSQIDAESFKFNKLEPVVIPNTNYVLRGNMYDARVFLAAFDTTQKPEVLVGRVRTTKENGMLKHEMVGDYETLKVDESGKAMYQRPGNSLGSKEWGGIIRIQQTDGSYIEKTFSEEYQVAEGSVVVAPTKMNVFYNGVDNPVQVSVSGVPDDKIRVNITNGVIEGKSPNFTVKTRRTGNCQVIVSAEIDGKWQEYPAQEFRVKKVPDPIAKVNRQSTGGIDKNVLLAQSGIQADMENFDFDLNFKVTEFIVTATIKGFARSIPTRGNTFTQEQRNLIQNLGRNDKIYIEGIKAIGPDGVPRELSTITLMIN